MKPKLLFYLFLLSAFGLHAQTKSTGTVSLLSGMTAKLDLNNTTSTATLTLSGPSDRWFALQIGSFTTGQGMQAGQDVVYYDGTTLVDAVHNGIGVAPTPDVNNWTVQSNTVSAGTRTIVATRTLNVGSGNDYNFVYANPTIDFAFSKMSSASYTLAYHGPTNRGYLLDVPFSTLGIDDMEQQKEHITLHPNPAKTAFSITSTSTIKQVKIYDAFGKQVAAHTNPLEQISVSGLSAGIYFVEIEALDNVIAIKKLIKE